MKYLTHQNLGRVLMLTLAVAIAAGWLHVDPLFAAVPLVGLNLNLAGARVIDPILTNVAQGYRNGELIGKTLFPAVPVQVSGGQIIEFGREAFKLYNARRAPGGSTKRIEFGYLGRPFALVQDSLEAKIPREFIRDASRVPGIDMASRAVNTTMKPLTLQLEVDQAALAFDPSQYDSSHKSAVLAGSSKWSYTTTPVDPKIDIDAGREAVRASVGVYPNVAVFGAVAWNAFLNNAKVIDRFKYTSANAITEDMIARLLQVDKVVVGKAIYTDDDGTTHDIWGNYVSLAYTNLGSMNAEEPSFGYTYTMEGNPMVEPPYYDNNAKSWIYGVNYERLPVLSGISSGYIIQTPA
jgi:hypothetical protein